MLPIVEGSEEGGLAEPWLCRNHSALLGQTNPLQDPSESEEQEPKKNPTGGNWELRETAGYLHQAIRGVVPLKPENKLSILTLSSI